MDSDGGKPPLLLRMVDDSDDLKFMLVLLYQSISTYHFINFCNIADVIVCDDVGQLCMHSSAGWHMQMRIMIVSFFSLDIE